MAITVSDCIVYPLKSGRGLHENEVKVDLTGLSGDRKFMLVDANGYALTQKRLPQLATYTLESLAALTPLHLTNRKIPVKIYNDSVNALKFHDETNAALSSIFKTAVKMVFFPQSEKRSLEAAFSLPGRSEEHTSELQSH